MKEKITTLLILLLLIFPGFIVGEEEDEVQSKIKHPARNVLERKLVVEKVNTKLVLKENKNYAQDTAQKNFKGDTLVYVTPWNNHGYDTAKIFNSKFTYVSPVWFQLKFGEKVRVTGTHDIDEPWIAEVRGKTSVKIVPRVIFEGMREPSAAFGRVEEVQEVLKNLCIQYKFDGLVIDGLSGSLSQQHSESARAFFKVLADSLHKANKEIILVLSPSSRSFGAEDLKAFAPFIDRFSLMTYDHSSVSNPGAIAPISWVEQTAQALAAGDNSHKVMVGISFYGFNYVPQDKSGDAIVGETYLQLLKKFNPKVVWDSNAAEHYFTYEDKGQSHLVYFPTLKSIHERLKLIESMGMSLSIWEIGQGLDYFFDLL